MHSFSSGVPPLVSHFFSLSLLTLFPPHRPLSLHTFSSVLFSFSFFLLLPMLILLICRVKPTPGVAFKEGSYVMPRGADLPRGAY
jgi:hypothetical protein